MFFVSGCSRPNRLDVDVPKNTKRKEKVCQANESPTMQLSIQAGERSFVQRNPYPALDGYNSFKNLVRLFA